MVHQIMQTKLLETTFIFETRQFLCLAGDLWTWTLGQCILLRLLPSIQIIPSHLLLLQVGLSELLAP